MAVSLAALYESSVPHAGAEIISRAESDQIFGSGRAVRSGLVSDSFSRVGSLQI